MLAVVIVSSILALLCLIVGLLLSRSGSSGGLASVGGQDLEIFKKTKDRGWVKGLQIFLFMMTVILVIIAIVFYFIIGPNKPPSTDTPTDPQPDNSSPSVPQTLSLILSYFNV